MAEPHDHHHDHEHHDHDHELDDHDHDEEPSEALHRPSIDELMRSAADVFGPRSLGVVLTGMGSGGTEGLRAIKERGGLTLAESEETCVIFGMPKAAIEAGVIERTLPLDRIAGEILAAV